MSAEKLRVLMIGPGLKVTGGVSTVVNNWMDAGLGGRVELKYVPTLTESRAGLYPGKLIDGLNALIIYIRQIVKHYDLVHIHLSYGASFYRKFIFFIIARMFGTKILVHLHGSKFEEFYYGSPRILKWLISYMFKKADRILVLSHQWEKFIQAISPCAKTDILFNGAFLRERGGRRANGNLIITFMGRLGERKGTYDLVEAFSRIHTRYKTIQLLLCGDGDVEKIKRIVREKGLEEAVEVLGWVSGEAKEEIYRKSDIFILPSYNEGLPGAILEAMSYGLPVISTKVGGIPEAVVDGVNGILIEAGDISAMVNAIEQLLQNVEIRIAMADASRELANTKFNIYTLVDKLIDQYTLLGADNRASL